VTLQLLVARTVIVVVCGGVALGLVVAGLRDLRRRNLWDAAWFGVGALLFGVSAFISTVPPAALVRWF